MLSERLFIWNNIVVSTDIDTMKLFINSILLKVLLIVLTSCQDNIVYDFDEIDGGFVATIERGAIKKDGSDDANISSYEHWIRSAFFIETNGAKSIYIPTNTFAPCIVWQYDSDHKLILRSKITSALPLDENCSYIRFHIRADNTPRNISVFLQGGEDIPKEVKRVQMGDIFDRIVYAVDEDFTTALLRLPPNYDVDGDSVPLIVWDSGDGSFSNWDSYEGGTYPGRLNGLSYLQDQGFAILEIYSWGAYYYRKYPGCGRRSAMPIPTHIATHEKGVEYVLSRYNIDKENIFHVSKSGSGKIALYYAMIKPSFNLKSIYAFAPVFDDLNFVGWGMKDYRQALFEELDLQGTEEEITDFIEGTPYDYDISYIHENNVEVELNRSWQMHKPLGRSFILKNAEKFKLVSVDWINVEGQTIQEKIDATHKFSEIFWTGYQRYYNEEHNKFAYKWIDMSLPALRSNSYTRHNLIRRGCDIPFTVIMSPTDEQTPYWNALEVVLQFQNAGEDARMITLKSGGHGGPDLSTRGKNVVENVATRHGKVYNNVSIGWYYVVEDIYNRFLCTDN